MAFIQQAAALPPASVAVASVAPHEPINLLLEWIAIILEGFNSFDELAGNSVKDIESLVYSFYKRTVNAGRITFGLCQTKRINSMIYWALNFQRGSEEPTIEGLD